MMAFTVFQKLRGSIGRLRLVEQQAPLFRRPNEKRAAGDTAALLVLTNILWSTRLLASPILVLVKAQQRSTVSITSEPEGSSSSHTARPDIDGSRSKTVGSRDETRVLLPRDR